MPKVGAFYMTPRPNSFPDAASEAPRSIGETLSDAASQLKNKGSDLGQTATQKLNETRSAAASGLESAASALHQGGEKVTGLAHTTADKLNSTADYLRKNDVKRMMADVQQLVVNNPGPSLIAAVVIGFFMGRALRSDD
jgi:hypothetical protein